MMENVISTLLVVLGILFGFATILALLMPRVRAWFKLHSRGVMATVAAVVVIVSLAIWWMWSSGTPPTPSTPSVPGAGWSWSPTPSDVWVFFKDYWMWVILVLTGLYFLFDGITSAPAWSKGAKGMVVAVAVLMAGAMAVHGIWGEKPPGPQQTEGATVKQPTVKVLTIPAGGKSERIPVPYRMHVVMDGKDFRFNCVYGDGSEKSFVKGETPCPDGDMPFVYATNERRNEANVITYSYAK